MAEALPEYPDSDFSDDDSSPLDISFNKAADHIRKITSKLDSNRLLELYGLFKQGTEGNCNTPKPGWFDAKGRKKWEAWRNVSDMTIDEAKQKYVELVQKYDPDWSNPSAEQSGTKETWVAVSSLRHSPEPELHHNELSLIDAAREDCYERVTELLTLNPELKDQKDEDGLTALHWAADRDATMSLKAALKGGCFVDATDETGQTALHYAVSCAHIESTKILMTAGASLLKDENGITPLDLADNDEIRNILESYTS